MASFKKIIFIIIILNIFCIISNASSLDNFTKKAEYNHNFKDMKLDGWYFDYVKQCYELGIINGKTAKKFGVNDNLTIAETITLASRVHSIYTYGKINFEILKKDNWYENVVDYAIENKIIEDGEFLDYEKSISKLEASHIFSNILPNEEMKEIKENITISDLNVDNIYYDDILMLYKAGILTGDVNGNFNPENLITRAEASVIICRIVNSKERINDNNKKDIGIINNLQSSYYITMRTYEEVQNIKIPILCYHTLKESTSEYNSCVLEVQKFAEDMRILKESYCNTIFLSELIGYMEGKNGLPEKSVVITFDDGYSEVYKYALPIIQKYGLKINLALIGKNIDRVITTEEVIKLEQSGNVEFVAHSYNMHKDELDIGGRKGILPKYGETKEEYKTKLKKDMDKIQTVLYNLTGKNSETYVYPYGANSDLTEEVLKELGIKATITTESGVNALTDGLYRLKRFNRDPSFTSEDYINQILISML